MTPFDIVNNLNSSRESIWSDETEKAYNGFLVNRAMSYQLDTIFLAEGMNRRSFLDRKLQYDFYLTGIDPKKKRFAKWAKPEKDVLIDKVARYFNVNPRVAAQYISLVNKNELNSFITKIEDKGGRDAK